MIEDEINKNCYVMSGRNYCTDLERLLSFEMKREKLKCKTKKGRYTRYYVPDKDAANKIIDLLVVYYGLKINESEREAILNLYPSNQ